MARRSSGVALRRFWRLPVVAVLAGVLAFSASYLFPPKYVAHTRLLVRARNTTFLNNSGETLGSQNGIFDSQLTQALSETQSALLGSNQIATTVVKKLHLDAPKRADHSIVGTVKNGLKSAIKHTTAWVVHGTYKNTDRFTQAVDDVQSGLSSHQVDASYVLELDASASTPQEAVDIATTAADELVRVGAQRFASDAEAHKAHLTDELTRAGQAEQSAAAKLGQFLTANGVSAVDVQSSLNADTKGQLQTDLAQTDIDLSAAQAQQVALTKSMAALPQTCRSTSSVQTGRSTTNLNQSQPCDTFQKLLIQKAQNDGDLASLRAKHDRLAAVLTPGGDLTNLPAAKQAQLQQLEAEYTTTSAAFTQLETNFQQAIVTGANDAVELTRIDRPTAPTYPSSPKRYLYLAMGIVTGAVLGLLLSALAAWRKGGSLFPDPVDPRSADEETEGVVDLVEPTPRLRRRAPVPLPAPLGSQAVVDLTADPAVQRSRVGQFEVFERAPETDDWTRRRTAKEG